jgi:hypothetical protein
VPGDFQPRRGDDVEAWLRQWRDQYADDAWRALDDALDDYRLHADTGAPLSVPAEELGHP